jgi:hypothetical protein
MTFTLTFAWWWLGAGGLLVGLLLAFLSPEERGSFLGWGYSTFSRWGWFGILLVILSILYLLFGFVARVLP